MSGEYNSSLKNHPLRQTMMNMFQQAYAENMNNGEDKIELFERYIGHITPYLQ